MSGEKEERERTYIDGERAMVDALLEASPDAVGVAVIRLDCECRKMAAVNKEGEPASNIMMYRHQAESVCDLCKEDNGNYTRVTEQFISWAEPEPDKKTKNMIIEKVLGVRDKSN